MKPSAEPGTVAPMPGPAAVELSDALDQYGDMIPYADPAWYQTVRLLETFAKPLCTNNFSKYHSPYFNQTHADLRNEVRTWVEESMSNIMLFRVFH